MSSPVICNQANQWAHCPGCAHATPHDPEVSDGYSCVEWEECWLGEKTLDVQCEPVQEDETAGLATITPDERERRRQETA